ncbi:hypothetical protein CPB83DRAFT_804398 [Crepidotus variabilis]|uniref:Uncharacterized protein n=1 Tax=Crepidotus variabilis TaxID=179855 RepID=A0A9P6JWC8_9AGAR|nr:hypothetical protein CPB83DRAFT_804398 [Crepidotus variabilis]
MSTRCLSRSIRAQVAQKSAKSQIHLLPNPFRRHSSSILFTLRPPDNSDQQLTPSIQPDISGSSSRNYAKESRWTDLDTALRDADNPHVVWTAYSNLLLVAGTESIPLQVHQRVLRSCCASVTTLRSTLTWHLRQGNLVDVSVQYDKRLRAVMQNIWNAGLQPTPDDYNFVLGRFAAVGNRERCWLVYKELRRHGQTPSQITFGYCLQSIAQRFSLPIPKDSRDALVGAARFEFSTYAAHMRELGIPMNPVTFDLSIRILGETLDATGFENLMKWGYGIDLSNPDRVALEFLEHRNKTESDGASTSAFPFTTTALNTTLDILGRLGDISRMITAFEVLTQPLPSANQHFFNSFEADEEDDFGVQVDVPSSAPQQACLAIPNTTTFNIMLRYLCRADNAVLSRHYINYARMLDRRISHHLRNQIMHYRRIKVPLQQILSPNLCMSPSMLVSALGQGNKDNNIGLLRWIHSKMPSYINACKRDLDALVKVTEEMKTENYQPEPIPLSKSYKLIPILELDIENPPQPTPVVRKQFNIARHIAVLERNYEELQAFEKRLDFVIRRAHERLKERLGRRVWEKKDVYFAGIGKRQLVPKEKWKALVNFKLNDNPFEYKANRKPWKPAEFGMVRKRRPSQSFEGYGPQPLSEPEAEPTPSSMGDKTSVSKT